jgi:hypothetical protein
MPLCLNNSTSAYGFRGLRRRCHGSRLSRGLQPLTDCASIVASWSMKRDSAESEELVAFRNPVTNALRIRAHDACGNAVLFAGLKDMLHPS